MLPSKHAENNHAYSLTTDTIYGFAAISIQYIQTVIQPYGRVDEERVKLMTDRTDRASAPALESGVAASADLERVHPSNVTPLPLTVVCLLATCYDSRSCSAL